MPTPSYGGPIPVSRYLVSAARDRVPAELTRLQLPIVRGIPFPIALDRELTLTLYIPLGVANVWREGPAAQIASSSVGDQAPNDPTAELAVDVLQGMPARLVLQEAGKLLAEAPLIAGARRMLPDDGGPTGTKIEVWILGWDLRAGSVLDAGDTGSMIDLAWRRVDRAADRFVQPQLDPRIAARMPAETAVQSELGGSGRDLSPKETQP